MAPRHIVFIAWALVSSGCRPLPVSAYPIDRLSELNGSYEVQGELTEGEEKPKVRLLALDSETLLVEDARQPQSAYLLRGTVDEGVFTGRSVDIYALGVFMVLRVDNFEFIRGAGGELTHASTRAGVLFFLGLFPFAGAGPARAEERLRPLRPARR